MNVITRIADRFSKNSTSSVIPAGISTVRSDGSMYDYIYLDMNSDVIFGGTVGFYASNKNASGDYSIGEFYPVCGYGAYDPTRALTTTMATGAAIGRMAVIPVNFKWFYPVLTVYGGLGSCYFDTFAT